METVLVPASHVCVVPWIYRFAGYATQTTRLLAVIGLLSGGIIVRMSGAEDSDQEDARLLEQAASHPGISNITGYHSTPQLDALAVAVSQRDELAEKAIARLRIEAAHPTSAWSAIDAGGSSAFDLVHILTLNASIREEPHIIACFEADICDQGTSAFIDYLLYKPSPLKLAALARLFDVNGFMATAKRLGIDSTVYADQRAKEEASFAAEMRSVASKPPVVDHQAGAVAAGISPEAVAYINRYAGRISCVLNQAEPADPAIMTFVGPWLATDNADYWRILVNAPERIVEGIAHLAPLATAKELLKLKSRK
jgi:hypothetical protein